MSRKIIDVGLKGNDGTGDPIREAFRKINDNFQELYTSLGLVQGFTLLNLSDTPNSYQGQAGNFVSIATDEKSVIFRSIVAGNGINFDSNNPNELVINSVFADIVADGSPQLGGDLSARSGGFQYRIVDLGTDLDPLTPLSKWEAVNKNYADSKVSRAGIDTLEYIGLDDQGQPIIVPNESYGVMTGPLVLSRDPISSDDDLWDGKTAATKRYVDGASYFSRINLHVSMNGNDARADITDEKQGRALAYSFKTIEAACRKAEDLILASPYELGPYKKVLTFNNGTEFCTLTDIVTSGSSGAGCVAAPILSVDTVEISSGGSGYKAGDLLTLAGGTGTTLATFEIIESDEQNGTITQIKLLTSGSYSVIPGATTISTTTNSTFGANATVNLTYRVSAITITNGGTNYGLASVIVSGGGGSGVFGYVNVVNGSVVSATVTEQGSGFTSAPTVTIKLPTFKINTGAYGTDFTKTPGPNRDIREGLFLRGETTGALAKILAHDGTLDNDDELFDVDFISGTFELGERISYGDPVKNLQIVINVESGIYYENLPIKIPANVSIMGDEFRRVNIRPRPGMSTSPWAFVNFRRDTVIDGLTVADQLYGYHYLTNSLDPVYPAIENNGDNRSATHILQTNKEFIKSEVIGWINNQISTAQQPFSVNFTYNQDLCKRDVGHIVDAIAFDLRWGGNTRTISAALKYYENASSAIAIGTQLDETVASIDRIGYLIGQCLDNLPPGILYSAVDQTRDPAYVAEVGSKNIALALIDTVIAIVSDSTAFNHPLNNDEMDMFLMNDATRLYQVTTQGHGGFALVLDPEGQILSKSPYAQVGTVFSKSTGYQTFAGGLFVDGFAGNQQFRPVSRISSTLLNVDNLVRKPQTPFSFQDNGVSYTVNYIRNYIFNANGSTATFVLDETTPYTNPIQLYNQEACSRDVALILRGASYDMVLGTNYHARKTGMSYHQVSAAIVLDEQLPEELQAIDFVHDRAIVAVDSYGPAVTAINAHRTTVLDIIENGVGVTPALVMPSPTGLAAAKGNAKTLLLANVAYIKAEVIGWINAQIAANTVGFVGLTYNSTTCARDIEFIVHAVTYDLIYGGNGQSVDAGLKYYDGILDAVTQQIPAGQKTASLGAINYAKYLVGRVIQNLDPATTYGGVSRTTGTASDGATALLTDASFDIVTSILNGGPTVAPAASDPTLLTSTYDANLIDARSAIVSSIGNIQTRTIRFVNNLFSLESITAGNRSMLANDFTQVCDMGYGVFATNGGLTEQVSTFTYYCYTAFFALNGAQIRSVGGSCANGVYALKAEGSDPLEIPTPVSLVDNVSQGAKVHATIGTEYENSAGDLAIYLKDYSYVPYNQCELEIDHSGTISRYAVTNVVSGGTLPAGVIKLNLSSAASSGTFSGALVAAVADDFPVVVRLKNQVKLLDMPDDLGTKPSTALIFNETPSLVYRITSISTSPGSGIGITTLRESYAYVDVPVQPSQPASHGGVGNTQIAVGTITSTNIYRLIGSQFAWKGKLHTITNYQSPASISETYGRLTFTPGLDYVVTGFSSPPTLKVGGTSGITGDISIKISTARFTSHDLLDIGTGSYADSNYPGIIYGDPANPKNQENEVQEIGKGRVFYVTTDQNGNFRVGPYFNIDQSTGSVSFSADLSLNNLDGIGFKRGVNVAEFSTDDTMTDNATDTVPTELAVRSYIDKRLGLTHTGGVVTQGQLIPVDSGGFMALNGDLAMKGDMDMGVVNRITNMADPVNDLDAVNKEWTKLANLQDGTLTSVANKDLVMLTGTEGSFVNVANNTGSITNSSTSLGGGSDVTFARSGNSLTIKLVGGQGANNPITNYQVNDSADIAQSKLLLNLTGTRAAAPTGTARQRQAASGVASFKDIEFTVTDGFVEFKTATSNANGVGLNKLTWVNGRSVIGNSATTSAAASNVLFTDVVNLGGSIKKDQYSTQTGYLKRVGVAYTNDTDYILIEDASTATADTLVRRDSSGDFAARTITVSNLYVDSKLALDTEALAGSNTGVIKMYAYRGAGGILLGDGAQDTDKVNFYDNEIHKFRTQSGLFGGTVQLSKLTTGAVGTAGTLVGNWGMETTSNLKLGTGTLDTTTGTLKSTTLTTGSDATTGTITGTWTIAGSGQLKLSAGGIVDTTSGTLKSTSLTAGGALVASTITGAWSLSSSSVLSPGNGTIVSSRTENVGVTDNSSSGSTTYIAYVSAISNSQPVLADTGLTYVPSTNTLTASTFSGAFSGNITGNVTGNADTATKVVGTAANDTAADLVTATMGTNDFFRIRVGGASNAGWAEIATADDGTEPIYVRQYTGVFTTVARTATLLDGTGNTSFPGTVTATTFSGTATKVSNTLTRGSYLTGSNYDGSAATTWAVDADSANTASKVVVRDGSGNFSAGTITATLSGSASTAAEARDNYFYVRGTSPSVLLVDNDAGGVNVPQTRYLHHNSQLIGFLSAAGGWTMNVNDSGTVSATLFSGTATTARYADLAERYESDKEYKPGTVVVFGGSKEITQSTALMDTRVAGVISTNPAHLMNSEAGDDKTHPPVALTGRVPCRVIGKIQKGDMLVTSSIPGVAIATTDPKVGTVIGKSLENYDSDHIGLIEVVVGRA